MQIRSMRSAGRFARAWIAAAALAGGAPCLAAQAAPRDSSLHVTFGAFVDSYYAWDFGRPPTIDRSFAGGASFTTQPARHNEFNVNLAFVEATLSATTRRGRVALQAGTSVQSNYSGEPINGQASGPALARMIQEATVGVKLADGLWVDGGIFFSHMGLEGWISRDNPTYTRSLVAEYSPYYQAGARMTWTATPRLTARLDVVNGWQNISETNDGKGAGMRLDYAATPGASISYYNFFSSETGNRLRTFNGIGARAVLGGVTMLGEADVGTQRRDPAIGGTSTWYGASAIARLQVAPRMAVVGRLERYDDADQAIVATSGPGPARSNGALQANGASFGIDVSPQPRTLWRTEVRGFRNRTPVFPDGATGAPRRTGGFVVSSLALTF